MLKIQDLVARSARQSLRGLSFKLENGQILAVLGSSDSGGHLLGQILAGLHPRGGKVISGDIQFNTYHYHHLARVRPQIGYLSNPVSLPDFLTGFELLDLVGSLYHLSPAERSRRIGELESELKIGQAIYAIIERTTPATRQKIALAAAMTHEPKLLILDEPTQFLDFTGQRQVESLIAQHGKNGAVVILITNNLDFAARLAERFIILDDGQKLLEGTLAELINQTKPRARSLAGVWETLFGDA